MKTIKKLLATALVFTLLIGINTVTLTAPGGTGNMPMPGGAATIAEKSEIVYSRLSGRGAVSSIYVVNHFSLSEIGAFNDYGNYSSVTNLTDLLPITIENGEISAATSEMDYYYQGSLISSDLPWAYDIAFSIDGSQIAPEMLAGMSGKLEIQITSGKNGAVDEAFYNNYMQQITVTLSTDKCRNITAPGATVAGAGKNRVLTYVILPKNDADIHITADVNDFEMAGIEIIAMQADSALGELAQLPAALSLLADGLSQTSAGMNQLATGYAQAYTVLSGAIAQIPDHRISEAQLGALIAGTDTANQALIGMLIESYAAAMAVKATHAMIAAALGSIVDSLEALSDSTDNMEDLVRDFAAQVGSSGDFSPVSFTSSKNGNICFVQFVFITEGISKPELETSGEPIIEQPTFFDRLLRLFSKT